MYLDYSVFIQHLEFAFINVFLDQTNQNLQQIQTQLDQLRTENNEQEGQIIRQQGAFSSKLVFVVDKDLQHYYYALAMFTKYTKSNYCNRIILLKT